MLVGSEFARVLLLNLQILVRSGLRFLDSRYSFFISSKAMDISLLRQLMSPHLSSERLAHWSIYKTTLLLGNRIPTLRAMPISASLCTRDQSSYQSANFTE